MQMTRALRSQHLLLAATAKLRSPTGQSRLQIIVPAFHVHDRLGRHMQAMTEVCAALSMLDVQEAIGSSGGLLINPPTLLLYVIASGM